MSSQAIAGIPADEAAVGQRIQQLQALIEQTRAAVGAATPVAAPTAGAYQASSAPNFAEALQSASSTGVASAASGSSAGAAGSTPYDQLISQSAARYGIDPAVLHGLIQQESGFDPNATSSAGAMGLTQLMPGTASSLGVSNPMNPAEAVEGGARYLSQLMGEFGGNTSEALAAYNAGPGAVKQYGGIPPYAETQSYVTKVLGYAEAFRQSHPATSAGGLA
jgi:soluble lytic murein transglycosylase-like protein